MADAGLLSSARLTPPQYGRTLLHVAAVGNRLALARLLLDRGANPAATDVVRPPLLALRHRHSRTRTAPALPTALSASCLYEARRTALELARALRSQSCNP